VSAPASVSVSGPAERSERRLGNTVAVLRWLAAELAVERHPLAHVPAELARALLDPPDDGCRVCDGPLPAPAQTGRPRVLCLHCSPRRKTSVNVTVGADTNQREAQHG
jgi:hypothetical protein